MDTHPQPFYEGTKVQWAWDSTSLGWLKECRRVLTRFEKLAVNYLAFWIIASLVRLL